MTDKKGFDHAPGSWRRRALAVLASALIVAAAGCVEIPTPMPSPTPPPTSTPESKIESMALRVFDGAGLLNLMLSQGWMVERVDRIGPDNDLIYLLVRVSTPIRTPEPTATASRR